VRDLIRRLITRLSKSRIARDSGVLLIANWSATALSIVTSVVLTHLLGGTGYGLMILTMAIVNTLVQFLDIRTGEGMVRFVGSAVARGEKREAFSFFTVGLTADTLLMIATMLLVWLLAPKAALAYPDRATLGTLVRIYMLTIPFSTLEGSFQAVVTVHKRFNLSAAARIIVALAGMVALLSLAPYGLEAVMWGQVIAAAASFLVWMVIGGTMLVRRIGLMRPEGYIDAWRQFFPFAFHTSANASLKAIRENIDSLLLGALLPVSAVGYFRVAYSAVSLITMPTAPISTVIYPEMNEAWAQGRVRRVRELIRKYTLVSLVAAGAAWLGYLIAADWLIALLYPPDFASVGNLIRLMGFQIVVQSALRWIRPAAMTVNRPQLVTYYSLIETILGLGTLIIFAFYWGLIGAAASKIVVMLIMIAFQFLYVVPRLGLNDPPEQPPAQ
jgi:O-antigen/teichoic acid export membrane protein